MDFISWYYTARAWVDSYAYTVRSRWLFTLVWALALSAVIWRLQAYLLRWQQHNRAD